MPKEQFPTGHGIVSTATSPVESAPSQEKRLEHPDYLRLILTAQVYDVARETPLTQAPNLSTRLGRNVLLKREDMQPVFSFKCRGAYNRMFMLSEEEKARGVVACSAGNHAQGVALAAGHLNITATIVMPMLTPDIKVNSVRRLGANVVLFGADFDEAKAECNRLAELNSWTNIPPYDDPYVIAGQGTVGVEILRQAAIADLGAIFVGSGGGGLLAGISAYVKRIAPHVRVIGVETEDAAGMRTSLDAGKRVLLGEVGLFADGAAVRYVGRETFRVCKENVDEVVLVNNDEICAAIKDTFLETRAIVEPAGALALAGLKKWVSKRDPVLPDEDPQSKRKSYIAVLSGANMDFDRLRFVAERAELGEGREAMLSVAIPETPGSFLSLHSVIHPRAISEFSYRYSDPKTADIFISIVTKNRDQEIPGIISRLRDQGMEATDLSKNELAKTHARFMVGGRGTRGAVQDERLISFTFPERPGALRKFLTSLASGWNISLFHYRNIGGDTARVLVGIQVPESESEAFSNFLEQLGYPWVEETDNLVYHRFLR
ncbi:MAG: tryptophan synthase beta subunit-like PLP-dependent enzyme [Piptocephalis tieghemiana]|nr:MAG: tryptophan synthase beta subunit-like PLP-dependent enzyme [Piptocephalis tieghemiana]